MPPGRALGTSARAGDGPSPSRVVGTGTCTAGQILCAGGTRWLWGLSPPAVMKRDLWEQHQDEEAAAGLGSIPAPPHKQRGSRALGGGDNDSESLSKLPVRLI